MQILIVEDDHKIASFIKKGLIQAGFHADHATDLDATPLKNGEWISLTSAGTDHQLNILTKRISEDIFLQLGTSSQDRDHIRVQFRRMVLAGIIPFLLAGITGGYFLSLRVLSPLRHIIRTVKAIDAGQMNSRVPLKGTGDELDELARLFNKMIHRISRLIKGMEESLDIVAHDLRTPLTRLRVAAEDALTTEPDAYFKYYNCERKHSALDKQTPAEVFMRGIV